MSFCVMPILINKPSTLFTTKTQHSLFAFSFLIPQHTTLYLNFSTKQHLVMAEQLQQEVQRLRQQVQELERALAAAGKAAPGKAARDKIAVMSSEVVDSNPYRYDTNTFHILLHFLLASSMFPLPPAVTPHIM